MTQSPIDISPDDTHPEGGHGIVRIDNVATLPEALQFTISALPDDLDEGEAAAGWTLGERTPLAAELTTDGLVMKIDPDIVDAPELQPGTPVVFVLPAADIRVELVWPDLPITLPDRLTAPVMSPSELRGHRIDNQRRAAEAAARAEADRALVDAIAASLAGDPAPSAPPADAKPNTVINLTDISAALRPAAAMSAMQRADAARAPVARARAPLPPPSPALNLAVDPAPAGPPLNARAVHGPPPLGLPPMSASRALVPVAVADDEPGDSVLRRHGLSIVLAVVAVPAVVLALWPSLTSRVAEQPSAQTALTQFAASDRISRIFAVGDVSPGGINAATFSADQALKQAEAAIFDGEGNLAERRFWLRKSISLMLAKPDTRWAMTQLGTLRTAADPPRNAPDYRSAKTLWEIASASGDTVATCFLAQLYRLGLGVRADPDNADAWLARAEARGGCSVQHERATKALTN